MNESANEPQQPPRDAAHWSKPVGRLSVPEEVLGLNVEGRRVAGPVQGFGKMWQKSYRVRLPSDRVSAPDLIKEWKTRFASFWPRAYKFHGPLTSLSPGDVAVLDLKAAGPVRLSTGVFVMYADDEAFTIMTPQGHQFAAWITFSAWQEDGHTVAQVQPLFRAGDPLYELAMPVMTRMEDRFWSQTLRNLAAHFGLEGAEVERQSLCVDRKRQWRMAGNVWHNAGIRTVLHALTAPLRWLRRTMRRSRPR